MSERGHSIGFFSKLPDRAIVMSAVMAKEHPGYRQVLALLEIDISTEALQDIGVFGSIKETGFKDVSGKRYDRSDREVFHLLRMCSEEGWNAIKVNAGLGTLELITHPIINIAPDWIIEMPDDNRVTRILPGHLAIIPPNRPFYLEPTPHLSIQGLVATP